MGESNSKVLGEADLKRLTSGFQMMRRQTSSGLTYFLDQTGREIAIKELRVGSNYEMQVLCETIQAKIELQHDSLVNYIGCILAHSDYYIYKPQICSGSDFKVLVVCDYPFKSLKEEIDERVVGHDLFSEAELWSILYSCVKGLDFLMGVGIDYDAVSSRNVLLDKEGRIKLNDPWLNASDASQAFVCRDDLLNRYLPPELTAANAQVTSVEGLQRANMYSLGVVLLECIFLRAIDELDTTVAEKAVAVERLLKELDKVKELSWRMRRVLRKILDERPGHRLSYADVMCHIDQGNDRLIELSQPLREQEELELKQAEEKVGSKPDQSDEKTITLNTNMLDTKKKPSISISPTNKPIPNLSNPLGGFSGTGMFGSANGFSTNPFSSNPFSANRWSMHNSINVPSWNPTSFDPSGFRNTAPTASFQATRKMEYDTQSNRKSISKPPQPQPLPAPSKITPTAPLVPPSTEVPLPKEAPAPKPAANQLTEVYRQYDDGSTYEGQQLNGERHGYGRIIYPGGREYIGNWVGGNIEGQGKLFNTKKELIFEGLWKKSTKEGYGRDYNEQPKILQQTFDYRDLNKVGPYWIKYEGNFRNNKRHGQGKLTLTNNEIFEGEFQEDVPEGKGTYNTLHKGKINGVWKKGVILY